MNLKDLADELGLDMEEFRELILLFVETSLADLELIRAGARQGEPMAVANAAHSIKGAAGNLGVTAIYETARSLEMKAKQHDLEGIPGMIAAIADELTRLALLVQDGAAVSR